MISDFLRAGCFILMLAYSSTVFGMTFANGVITAGGCELNVLVAETQEQKINGMLGFTDDSFPADGMIFIGIVPQKQYYHTMGMKMDIRIMGVKTISRNKYRVNGGAVFAPTGKRVITVFGDSVLEVPEKLYQSKLKDCLFMETSGNE